MKNSLALLCLAIIFSTALHAQTKTNKFGNKAATKLNSGIKVPNIKLLYMQDLGKLNLPIIAITDIQKNAKALTK